MRGANFGAVAAALVLTPLAHAAPPAGTARTVVGTDRVHVVDDRPITLGGALPTPDVAIDWCTTGTDYLAVQTDSGLVVQQDDATDRTNALALASGGSPILACSDDAVDLKCGMSYHDGTDAIYQSGFGKVRLVAAGVSQYVEAGKSTYGAPQLDVLGSATSRGTISITGGAVTDLRLIADYGAANQQAIISPGDGLKQHIILSNRYTTAHGHPDDDDVALDWQGQESPAAQPNQWGRIVYRSGVGEDYFYRASYEGPIVDDPATAWVLQPGANTAGAVQWVDEVETVAGATALCASLEMDADYTYTFRATMTGQGDAVPPARAAYTVEATFFHPSAGPSAALGAVSVLHTAEDATCAAGTCDGTLSLAGDVVSASVTGLAGNTMNWACTVQALNVTK